MEKALEGSLASRDFTYAGMGRFLPISKHFRGLPLPELATQIEEYFQFVSKVKDPYFPCFLTIYRQMIRNLQGLTRDRIVSVTILMKRALSGGYGLPNKGKELLTIIFARTRCTSPG